LVKSLGFISDSLLCKLINKCHGKAIFFSFGIYELFISQIDVARRDKAITILEIKDLDELKNKIIKVIIMVLIVSFFSKVLNYSDQYDEPLEMLYFALSILALSLGVYLIKVKH